MSRQLKLAEIGPAKRAVFSPNQPPMLVVVIDCEEDFDWTRPLRHTEYNLDSTHRLMDVQAVFGKYGVVPTYVVGYPIVDHATAWQPLARLLERGQCLIGAHLHPWVTPPYLEISNLQNSFPGNLPVELELAKLRTLTERITNRFGRRPTVYKAGRYGFGPGTVAALRELDFEIDVSFMPHWDYRAENGPSFLENMASPFWLDPDAQLLEIPATTGFTGSARRRGPKLYQHINTPLLRTVRLTAALARTGVLNRVRLSPEGIRLDEAKALTRSLLEDGLRVFQLTFHSTSLVPASTPYVSNDLDLRQFIGWIEQYVEFFRNEVGGVPASPEQVLARAREGEQRAVAVPGHRPRDVAIPLPNGLPASSRPSAPARPSSDVMHILLCCNVAYMQHLAVLITSLAEQPTTHAINIVIVMNESSPDTIAELRRTLARYPHVTLTFKPFKPDPSLNLPIRAHYSLDIYTRLWVAEFFDKTVERVLYLDCDMVVVGSLDGLWETPLEGRTIGAVSIPGSTRCAPLGFSESYGYFNSGVLLIDLARWRRTGAFGRLIDYISHNSEKLIDGDQDALNATLHADRIELDYPWNVTSPFYFDYHDLGLPASTVRQVQAEARIIHFNGASKPWSYFCQHPRRLDYYRYLELTEWRHFQPVDRTPINRLRRLASSLLPDRIRRGLRRRLSKRG